MFLIFSHNDKYQLKCFLILLKTNERMQQKSEMKPSIQFLIQSRDILKKTYRKTRYCFQKNKIINY